MSDDEPDDLGFLDDFASESQLSQLNDNDDDDNDNVVSSLDSLLNEVEAQLSDEDDDDDVEKKKKSYDFDEGEDSENEEEEEMKVQELPEHACAYCNIFDAECVVKCLDCEDKGGCKWFCNGRPHGSGYSCIVQHLVRGRHKQVQLHPSSPLGDTVLECYSTGNRNVFQLGFVPAKSENVVVLLTRDVCVNRSKLEEMSWDPEEWLPLIKDGEFRDWLVKRPSEKDLMRARRVTKEQIIKLEDVWKTNAQAKLEDLEKNSDEDDITHILPCYEDGFQYQNIFAPLVKMAADEDKILKENQTQEGLNLEKWDRSLNKKHVAVFRPTSSDGGEIRIVPGDELVLRRLMGNGELWESKGVVKIVHNGAVHVQMNSKHCPTEHLNRFSLEFVWKSVSFDRMQDALRRFALDDESVSQYIFHQLLGHQVVPQTLNFPMPKRFSAPGLPELNHSQAQAVKSVLQMPMALIQGPPGTGKTVTSASILYHIAKQLQKSSQSSRNSTRNNRRTMRGGRNNNDTLEQILVCAPSNVAVEQLTAKIHRTGLRVVRVAARSRENVESNVEDLCLHNMVRAVATSQSNNTSKRGRRNLRKLFQLKNTMGELSARDERKFRTLCSALEQELLRNAQVICTTCSGAGDPRLKKFRFRTVLIDEATQATEPECLIPILKGCRRLILVGDHCQLGPVVVCKRASKAGLSQSLFERLVILGIRPVRLEVQYRMHPGLSEFPSNTFYEGSLQNGVTEEERVLNGVDFPWPRPDLPMFFYVNAGAEEIGASGTSFLNRTEAAAVERVVTMLLQRGCTPDQIGVVTPYEGQRAFVESYMERHGAMRTSLYRDIEVTSVDAFQGREKDIIILSCVRSNERQGIGFLSDPRRLNVALTRAKYGVVIVGNPTVLSRHMLWNNLLVHFKERGVLVEGPLSNLKTCMLRFRPARKYYNRRKYQMMARSYLNKDGDGVEHNIPAAFPGGPTVSSGQLAREAPSFNSLEGEDRSGGARHSRYFGSASQSTQDNPYASAQYYDPRSYFSQQTQSATQQSQTSTLGSGFMNDDVLMTQPPQPGTQSSVLPASTTTKSNNTTMTQSSVMTQDMIQTQAMTQDGA